MQTFVFDLDGTLIDSDRDLAAAANAARATLSLPPLPTSQVACWVGYGLTHLLTHALPGVGPDDFARARAVYVAHYRDNLLTHTEPYPGAESVLNALGGRAGLVTNKPSMFTDGILDGLGWRRHFAAIVPGDALPQRKPAPEPLVHALEQLGVDTAAYVGDSEVDAATAAAAGVPFVAVDWGRVAGGRRVADLRDLLELAW